LKKNSRLSDSIKSKDVKITRQPLLKSKKKYADLKGNKIRYKLLEEKLRKLSGEPQINTTDSTRACTSGSRLWARISYNIRVAMNTI
jgi:hypothetical protein